MKNKNLNFEPYEGEASFIFASYSHKTLEVIDDVEYLNKMGFRVWYDKGILDGTKWRASITDHLLKCKLFLIFVSENALNSDYVMSELDIARHNNKIILPIFLTDQINPNDIDHIFLMRIQGINRWKFVRNLPNYYAELSNKLDELDLIKKIITKNRDNPKGGQK